MAKRKITPSKTKIGWVGTGVMGASMCRHIIEGGYRTFVFNRTEEKAGRLVDAGAVWTGSPQETARKADVVFTIVGFPSDVREVYFGDEGILKGVNGGEVLVDMTTTEPTLAKEIYNAAKLKGCGSIDAPVSGGDVGAAGATLSIMLGGDEGTVDEVMPLLELLGDKIVYQGGPGSGQHTKMCNQITVAGMMIGVCEGLVYAYRAGLDVETVLTSIRGGAASSWALDNLAPRMLKRDFEPGFFVEHFIKDMGIALAEAQKMNLSLPGLALVNQLYVAVSAKGHGRSGTQALILALEEISGI
ncbi:MAG: NAD(P)-dependent oxidoreductase [Thermodesulfobacteriota bacterium]